MKISVSQDEKTRGARNVIAIFARAPQPGKVKTRLAQSVGEVAAREIYKAMLRDVFEYSCVASRMQNAEVVVFHTPNDAFSRDENSLRALWSGAHLAQSDGDLGDKLCDCFQILRENGAQKIVVIGSDAPDLPPDYLTQAFDELKTCDLVFGAAQDGGFYLVGASCQIDSAFRSAFHGVRWSSENTLRDVLHNIEDKSAQFLKPWRDVDTIDDLRALRNRLRDGESVAPHTHRVLDALFDTKTKRQS